MGDQLGDNDLSNNRDYYYLRDAMGGHVGLIFDHDDTPATPNVTSFAVHDAFGNKMSAGGSGPGSHASGAGSFAWRGGEGSVTDSEPNLVHMQARHYDPSIGRFLQADSLMLASMTTQGTNRYLYTENDPVNRSDPSGEFWWFLAGILALGIVGGIFNMVSSGATAEHFANGFLGGVVSAALGMLFLALPGGPYLVLAALGIGFGNALTSYWEGDLADIVAMKGGFSCILGYLLTKGELASPWGVAASMIFWFLANVFWDLFTGGSLSLRAPATDNEVDSERLCATMPSGRRRSSRIGPLFNPADAQLDVPPYNAALPYFRSKSVADEAMPTRWHRVQDIVCDAGQSVPRVRVFPFESA